MVCHTDAEVLAKALKAVRQAEGHFVWAQLRDLAELFDQRHASMTSGFLWAKLGKLPCKIKPLENLYVC